MWHNILLVFHVCIAIGMVGLILLQQGKGADAGAAFGSGSSSTVFGARGSASFLSRTTAILAALFFVTSLTLAYMSKSEPKKPLITTPTEQTQPETQKQPALPIGDAPAADKKEPTTAPSELPVQ